MSKPWMQFYVMPWSGNYVFDSKRATLIGGEGGGCIKTSVNLDTVLRHIQDGLDREVQTFKGHYL